MRMPFPVHLCVAAASISISRAKVFPIPLISATCPASVASRKPSHFAVHSLMVVFLVPQLPVAWKDVVSFVLAFGVTDHVFIAPIVTVASLINPPMPARGVAIFCSFPAYRERSKGCVFVCIQLQFSRLATKAYRHMPDVIVRIVEDGTPLAFQVSHSIVRQRERRIAGPRLNESPDFCQDLVAFIITACSRKDVQQKERLAIHMTKGRHGPAHMLPVRDVGRCLPLRRDIKGTGDDAHKRAIAHKACIHCNLQL